MDCEGTQNTLIIQRIAVYLLGYCSLKNVLFYQTGVKMEIFM